MTEGELRELMGFGSIAKVTFADRDWEITPEAFGPLLRYIRTTLKSQASTEREHSRDIQLSALYGLLEGCVVDFHGFALVMFETKAGLEGLMEVTRQLVEFYCARPYWPALRLLTFLASSLDEFDGDFLRRSGRGIATLSAREACNLALAICLDGRSEEDRDAFYEDLNYEGSPEADAMEMVRRMKEAQAKPAQKEEAGDGGDRLG